MTTTRMAVNSRFLSSVEVREPSGERRILGTDKFGRRWSVRDNDVPKVVDYDGNALHWGVTLSVEETKRSGEKVWIYNGIHDDDEAALAKLNATPSAVS